MRRKVKAIDKVQKEFTDNQKALIASGVTPPEAIQITAQNRIQRVVEMCRKSHGGPITDESELNSLLENIKDDKAVKTALTAEIRYRKFTLLKIKESNPLFKQRNLSAEQLISNLRFILQKSTLGLVCSVSLEDLEKVVEDSNVEDSNVEDSNVEDESTEKSSDERVDMIEKDVTETLHEAQLEFPHQVGPWPPKLGDHLAVNFEDGFYLGEVAELVNSETVKVSYMSPKKISTASTELNPRLFWFWPSKKDIMDTCRAAVLPLRPVLNLAVPPSSKRFVVFKLENFDFIKKISEL